MSGPLVVGIDASTTACKAIAFDLRGAPVAEGRAPIALFDRGGGGWEQDALEWWTALETALGALVQALGPQRDAVAALSIACQRETFVVTDDGGVPLHPALVWMDARCTLEVREAVAHFGAPRLHALSGKPPDVTPSMYKARYLLGRLAPALRKKRPRFYDVHGFLAERLTGERATSLAAADPTGFVDLVRREYVGELLAFAWLDGSRVSRLVEPATTLGSLRTDVAGRVGLRAGLPVVAGGGDGQAAGLGAGVANAAAAYLNLGTALVSGVSSNEPKLAMAFRTLFSCVPGRYFLETDLKGGTFTLSWLAERVLGPAVRASGGAASADALLASLESEAHSIAPGSAGLFVVPYWNGVMNPYWDATARGMMVGLTGEHGAAHLYRAIVEGLLFEQRLHTSGVEDALGARVEELVVMGGAAKSDLVCQIAADILARPVMRAGTTEATALGAAMLAATGAGLFASAEDATGAMGSRGQAFTPGAAAAIYEARYGEYVTLYPRLRSDRS